MTIFANGAEQAALVGGWRDSFAQCGRDMAGTGLDPAWFGTSVTAADFEDVVGHRAGFPSESGKPATRSGSSMHP